MITRAALAQISTQMNVSLGRGRTVDQEISPDFPYLRLL